MKNNLTYQEGSNNNQSNTKKSNPNLGQRSRTSISDNNRKEKILNGIAERDRRSRLSNRSQINQLERRKNQPNFQIGAGTNQVTRHSLYLLIKYHTFISKEQSEREQRYF
ncbi:hypothetical protein C922_03317 [Plasmodium inui San Antonio 1]|uniref:Uncharacterized protein n=1 Tax=Plasmodium inui San Antonio 1 TaxID=1237626 RepID=W7AM40_9APIC|nr:hypothetical protein C922_03317 [Plasmodium inui San Antonio 1]EUD66401.1 hypothetical protein C922_03317 [Plasmodium inui San Antonio 1]